MLADNEGSSHELYVSRRRKQLAPKAARNRDILTRNKQRAATHHEHLQSTLARADTKSAAAGRRPHLAHAEPQLVRQP